MTTTTIESLNQILGPTTTRVRATFALMEIAESVLARHGLQRHRTARGCSAFMVLRPTALVEVNADLYELHADELAQRIVRGERFDVGTRAECIRAMLLTALKAPLNSDGMAALAWLVDGTFLAPHFADLGVRERWPGQAVELVTELRRKLSVDREAEGIESAVAS